MSQYSDGSGNTVITSDRSHTKGKIFLGAGATPVATIDEANNLAGLFTNSPSIDFSFGGGADRVTGMERNPTSASAGHSLTVRAGAPKSGETNQAGGDLILQGGIGTGSGLGGKVRLRTAKHGSTGTTDNALTDGVVVDEAGNVQLGPGGLVQASTDGFPYIPTVSAAPSGTPTAKSGFYPMVFCTADSKIYVYNGSAWIKTAALS